MKKTAALHNLGCKVNAYETDAMQELLAKAGFEIVPFDSVADVYVVNTCTVTNIADRKSRQMLHRCKKVNPNSILVAVGCYVQTSYDEAAADPDIDIILGNNEKSRIVEAIEELIDLRALKQETTSENHPETKKINEDLTEYDPEADEKKKVIYMQDMTNLTEYEPMEIHVTAGDRTRAFLKIQDGCNRFCSYCMIPYARGRIRSADVHSVMKEVEGLVKAGYKEIVLNGIHLASFGLDAGTDLLTLLEMLNRIEGLERIRLGSLEPGFINEESVERLKKITKLCPHFHLSLQSGCDTVLERMNRKYTTAEYKEKCDLLRKAFDRPAITTDIIVGFPGETEEEFQRTMAFVEEIRFYEVHVFKYSIRKGTVAASMKGQLTEAQKSARSEQLIVLTRQLKEEFEQSFDGDRVRVLFEESQTVDGGVQMIGHTRHYIEVRYAADESVKGRILEGILHKESAGSKPYFSL